MELEVERKDNVLPETTARSHASDVRKWGTMPVIARSRRQPKEDSNSR